MKYIVKRNIKNRMIELNFSQQKLAEKMGVASAMVNKFLNGDGDISLKTLCKYAKALETTSQYLITPDPRQTINDPEIESVRAVYSKVVKEVELLKKENEELRKKKQFDTKIKYSKISDKEELEINGAVIDYTQVGSLTIDAENMTAYVEFNLDEIYYKK